MFLQKFYFIKIFRYFDLYFFAIKSIIAYHKGTATSFNITFYVLNLRFKKPNSPSLILYATSRERCVILFDVHYNFIKNLSS
jgi:hypothetical protein